MTEPSATSRACRIVSARLYHLPVSTRTPYHFGTQTLDQVTCLRVALTVQRADGQKFEGWGETPLNIGWAWPGGDYGQRMDSLNRLILQIGRELVSFDLEGHPLEISHAFQQSTLVGLRRAEGIPYLPALVCLSAFDLALYDACGRAWDRPVYTTLGPEFLRHDLGHYMKPAPDHDGTFAGRYPADYLQGPPEMAPTAWHSVGAGDPLAVDDLTGNEPDDGYPVLLRDWIARDDLDCLKIKLSGQNYEHDYERICQIGGLARDCGCTWLCTDFNSTVHEVDFVTDMLDRLKRDEPDTYQKILYVEQPFPYEMKDSPTDVRAVSRRKPLYMDESAHDWELVREGRARGWTGVALKTCKTLTSAILMLCWAREHGMPLMVQDLTNPMLAQITHALLAAHAGTIMGLETNSMQYYPDASRFEASVHPGIFRRRDGRLDLSTVQGAGFGYRLKEINRPLPEPYATFS